MALLETNLWRISKEDWESYWSTLLDKEVWLLEAKNCTRLRDPNVGGLVQRQGVGAELASRRGLGIW